MNKEYTLPEPEPEDGGLNLWELSPAELAEFEQEFVKEDLSRLRNELDKALENVIKLVETKIPDVNLRITFMSRILRAANAYNQATTITETELHNLGAIYSSFLRKLLPFGAQLQGARTVTSSNTIIQRYQLTDLSAAEEAAGLEPFDDQLLLLGLGKEVVLSFRNTTLQEVVHPTSTQLKPSERESQLRFVIEGLMLASGNSPELRQAIYQENQKVQLTQFESLIGFYQYQLAKLIQLLTFLNRTYVDSIDIFRKSLEQKQAKVEGATRATYELLGNTVGEISAIIEKLQSIHASVREALLHPKGAKLAQRRDFEIVVKIMKPYLFGSDATRMALIDNLEPAGIFDWTQFYRTALKHAEAGIEPDFYKQLAATINIYLTNRYKDEVAPPVYTQNKLAELVPIERIDETEVSPINWDKLTERVRKAQQLGLAVIQGNAHFTPVNSPLRPQHITLLLSRRYTDLVRVAISFPSTSQTLLTPTIHLDLDLKKHTVDWDVLYPPDSLEYRGVLNAFTDYLQLSLDIPLSGEGSLYLEEVPPANNPPTVAVEEGSPPRPKKTAPQDTQPEEDTSKVVALIRNFEPVVVPQGEEKRYKKPILISEKTRLEDDTIWDYNFSELQKKCIIALIIESNKETYPPIKPIKGKKGFYRLSIPRGIPGLNNGVRVILRKSVDGYLIHKVRVRNEQTYT